MKNVPLGTSTSEVRQQIKSKMKYANAIIFIRECLWQTAINFAPPDPLLCTSTLSHMHHLLGAIDNFPAISISVDGVFIFFFNCALLLFETFSVWSSIMDSDWNFIQTNQREGEEKKQQSEIHVVYLMGKIIARQMKQSMTRSNQRDWLGTQGGGEVRRLALPFAVNTLALIGLVTFHSDSSFVPSL